MTVTCVPVATYGYGRAVYGVHGPVPERAAAGRLRDGRSLQLGAPEDGGGNSVPEAGGASASRRKLL